MPYSPACRSGKSRPRSIRSWAKEVWRKVRKPTAQWLQLALSFDLCDSTPWSPSAPSPRPAPLQIVPSPCLNPDPPTGAYGAVRPILSCPGLNCTGRCSPSAGVAYRCPWHPFLLGMSSDGGRDQEISFVLRKVTLLW